jgi:hypothetical protein
MSDIEAKQLNAFWDALFTGEPPSLVLPAPESKRGGKNAAGRLPPDRRGVPDAEAADAEAADPEAVRRAVAAQVDRLARKPAPGKIRILEGLSLLWHDHWEASHEIAQSHEGEPDFDLLHAILHRREGDFANSGYWFRGAGKHPCYPILERRLASLPEDRLRNAHWAAGAWSPHAFLAEVRKHADGSGEAAAALKRIQAEEFRAFAFWLLGGGAAA